MAKEDAPGRFGPDDQGASTVVKIASAPAQLRSLDAVRDVARVTAAEHLLNSTGPAAEMASAQMRGVLDAARRELIAKKGSGVVFEAETIVRLQDASERYGIKLTARLSTKANAPRADILLITSERQVDLQLKTGSDPYLRAAVRAREENVVLLVPSDVDKRTWAAAATATVEVESIGVESPTRAELHEQSQKALDRIARGERAFDLGDLAKSSIVNSFVDGLTAVVVDVSCQVLANPDAPIDWSRSAKCLAKTAMTGAVSSFLSGALARSSLAGSGRALDATGFMRAARASSCVIPRALDTIWDAIRLNRGELDEEQFNIQLARNAGAAAFEYVGFQVLARLTVRMGPLGRAIVMIAGGMVLAIFGAVAGEAVREMLAGSEPPPLSPAAVHDDSAIVSEIPSASINLMTMVRQEHARRLASAAKGRCEERGCRRKHHARGFCGTHYMRWWRGNRALIVAPQPV